MSDAKLCRSSIEAALAIARGRMDKPTLISHLEIALNATYREKGIKRAGVKSRKMTIAIGRRIRAHKRGHPNASEQEMATMFEVNQGRVSEALNGGWR
jgi:hypothetical protein